MSTEEHKAWHKQCAAKMKRADTNGQAELCYDLMDQDKTDTEILITLERTFFIGRKAATHTMAMCELFR